MQQPSTSTPESSSTGLKRELGLRDLTLFAISCIVGVRWVPAAAHAGPGSVTLWLLAAALFVAPLAVAIATLCAKYPGGGGFYLWTRNDFGPWHGFLCFWVYWFSIAFLFPSAAMFYTSLSAYAMGPHYAHLADNRTFLIAGSLAAIWIALGTNLVGMKIGKWTENMGGALAWLIAGLFVVLAAIAWSKRGSATHLNVLPTWNWDTANFWSSIAFAMTGLELAAMMGAEIRNPLRDLPRAGWIASTFAVAFYASLTVSLLILMRPEQINEMTGFAQAGETAARLLNLAWLTPLIALIVFLGGIGQFGGLGASTSRLPFAAGTDKLLPHAFAKIHSRWGTPYVSILTLGAVASFLLIVIQLGDTARAAYQEMVSLMIIAGFLPYIYIFGSAWKAGCRISAMSGWLVTALALICSAVPTAEIHNVWLFETKLALGTIATIGSAWLVYRRAS